MDHYLRMRVNVLRWTVQSSKRVRQIKKGLVRVLLGTGWMPQSAHAVGQAGQPAIRHEVAPGSGFVCTYVRTCVILIRDIGTCTCNVLHCMDALASHY